MIGQEKTIKGDLINSMFLAPALLNFFTLHFHSYQVMFMCVTLITEVSFFHSYMQCNCRYFATTIKA